MSKSRRGDLEVFDFKGEDNIGDIASGKQLNKFKSPTVDDQSVLKDEFLGYVSQVDKVSAKNVGSIPYVDVDAVGGKFFREKDASDPSLGTSEEKFDNAEDSEFEAPQQSKSISHENHPRFKLDINKYNGSIEPETKDTSGGVPSPKMSQIDIAPSGSPSSNESEANECMNESPSSSPVSEIAENVSLNGYGWNHCIGSSDMVIQPIFAKEIDIECNVFNAQGFSKYSDDANMEVILYPDYVIYQDDYYLGPKLTFSHCCIKINASSACAKQEFSNLDWEIDNVVDIKCQVFQSNGTVMIKICVKSDNTGHSNNVDRTAGIEELEIVVVDSNWSLKHKQITSLNVKYLAIWNFIRDMDMEGDENYLLGPKSYLPNFDEPFDEVIYPKGDPDAVSLSKRDVDLLQPDTFVNDTIIDFYIKYLKNQIKEEEKHRFHFFNSFFFRKLADMDKNPSSASDGRAAFLRVRKWTRKVNLFEKDYIFIPVNFNLHWSLIVLCHPGEVLTFNDEDLDKSLKVPCILHMDSIKGSHSGLKNLVRSYLWEEWKERQKDKWDEDLSSRFFNMRFLPLMLPQQENSYDCGLFLLHYLELFLVEAPVNFNPLKLTKFSNFLNVDWFPPAEAYLKRTLIQRLIFELLENRSHEVSSSDYSDHHHYLENNENRTGIEFLEEGFNSGINGESTTSHAGQGIEITLLSTSSSLDPHSGLVLRKLLEPGATTGELLGQCQSFDHRPSDYHLNSSIFPIEEDTETGEQFMYLTTDANFQQVAGIAQQTCELPYLSKDCGAEICHRPEITIQAEHDKAELSRDTSGCASDDSDDIGVIENSRAGNEAGSPEQAKRDEKNCSPTENLETSTEISGSAASNLPISTVVGSSQHSDTMCDSNNSGGLHLSCKETAVTPPHQVSDAVDEKVTCDDNQTTDDMAPDLCEEHAIKRRRLMPLERESDSVGTLTKESCL